MKKCVMIYNSKSGKKKSNELLPIFKRIINDKGYDFEIIYTKKKGHASKIIKELNHR